MSDQTQQLGGFNGQLKVLYKDMANGTYALTASDYSGPVGPTDYTQPLGGFGGQVKILYRDMGNGTHAPVIALSSSNSGHLSLMTISKNTDYAITLDDSLVRVDASSGPKTITLLPAAQTYNAATKMGQVFSVKKIDPSANMVTVSGATIDGAPNFQMANQFDCVAFHSNGTSYDVLFRSQ